MLARHRTEMLARYQTDMLVRNRMRETAWALRSGVPMYLLMTMVDSAGAACGHPCCHPSQRLFRRGQMLFRWIAVPASGQTQYLYFHLTCLEALWNGQGFLGVLPTPSLYQEVWSRGRLGFPDDPAACSLEGARDEPGRVLGSGPPQIHSHPHGQLATGPPQIHSHPYCPWEGPPRQRAQPPTHPPLSPSGSHEQGGCSSRRDSQLKSPTSNDGENIGPPTRFQHLAASFKADGLTDVEAAALHLWKIASVQQIRWDATRRRGRMLSQQLPRPGDASDSREIHNDDDGGDVPVRIKEEEEKEMVVKALEQVTGLTINACRSRNLSEVFRMLPVPQRRF